VQDDALFGSIAVQEGFLTQDQLDLCLRERDGRGLPDFLRERGLLTDLQIQAILDIQKIHLAEASAPAETGGVLRMDRFMLPCRGCDTYYLVSGLPVGTKFVCRKCKTVLTVGRPTIVPTPPPEGPPAGERLGPYTLSGQIGRGSMSVVYKAVDSRNGRTVALKVLKKSDHPSPGPLIRFQQEARAAQRLAHPNIVAVREAGEEAGTPFIAMDYVEGLTLDRVLGQGKLGLREFVTALEQVAQAVHHAHQLGIVHRDLKPANILVDDRGVPHVTDFGLAKLDHADKSVTHAGVSLGTPFYMSPEQVEGDVAGTDARSDIFSLGVMLYEALTGRVPFPGNSVMEVYRAILAGAPPAPAKLNPRAPADLEAVCLKALRRDKARRYSTAREFAEDLRRWLEGHPVLAKSPVPNPKAR
jgi:serine/threonine-protein kinase